MASVGWSEHAQASPARCPSSVVGYRLLSTDNAAPLLSAEAVAPMVLHDYLELRHWLQDPTAPGFRVRRRTTRAFSGATSGRGYRLCAGRPSHCRSVPRARLFG